MAPPSHRSSRHPKRRTTVVSVAAVAAVAAVGLAASLVMAFSPDRETDTAAAGKVGTTPAATTARSTEPTSTPERKPSTAPPKSPSASGTTTTPAPATTTESARPTPESTRQAKSGSASLAGRIRPGVDYAGVATFYDAGNGDGACSYGPTDDVMTAAMNTTDYEVSKACGAYVRVRAGGASVTVRITNECPSPCKPGQLDLSAQAFAKLADPTRGQIPITWSLLSPGTSDTLSIRYKTGSSQYWCGIQVIGHRNPVARLEVRKGGSWTPLPRTEYNYFLSEQGGGCGGALRITDIYGEQLTVDGIAVRPDAVQPTKVQFAAR